MATYGDIIREMGNEELAEAIISICELLETYKQLHKNSNSEVLIKYVENFLNEDWDLE